MRKVLSAEVWLRRRPLLIQEGRQPCSHGWGRSVSWLRLVVCACMRAAADEREDMVVKVVVCLGACCVTLYV